MAEEWITSDEQRDREYREGMCYLADNLAITLDEEPTLDKKELHKEWENHVRELVLDYNKRMGENILVLTKIPSKYDKN